MPDRYIYTAWIQKRKGALPFGRHTIPVMEDYARKCGATLRVITKTKRRNPQHATLDMLCEMSTETAGARALWVDLDIVIAPKARNVFDSPGLQSGMWVSLLHGSSWRKKEYVRYLRPRGHISPYPYFSSCLMLFSAKHAQGYVGSGADKIDYPPVGDQAILNELARKSEVGWQYFPRDVIGPHSMARQCEFIHCGGKRKGVKIYQTCKKLGLLKA